jgi:hypothetical protein
MSDTNTSGAYGPQDFSLSSCTVVNSDGIRMDMKALVTELSCYEDIYAFSCSGQVTFIDSMGYIEMLQIKGNEYIEIEFSKYQGSPVAYKKTFKVYKISNLGPLLNSTSYAYSVHFCSEEMVLSEQRRVKKSYTGKKIDFIVNDILSNELKIEKTKIKKIEETTGMYDFVMPNIKPFEAISWVSIYARPRASVVGADMLFFENSKGYYFRSLQSMYSDDVYATYKYQAKNIGDTTFEEKTTTVLSYEFVKPFDLLYDVNAGTFANKLITIDPLTRTMNTTTFSYKTYSDDSKSLNDNSVFEGTKNRFGVTETNEYDSSVRVAVSNSGHDTLQWIKDNPDSDAKDVAVETYLPNRVAQINLSQYTVLKMMIPGDPDIRAGMTINFLVPSLDSTLSDKYYSGKYLITAVRHIIETPTLYRTVLEVAKDSSATKYSVQPSTGFGNDGIMTNGDMA